MQPELSVVIVNYNGHRYLKDCLTALYDKLHAISFEIIIVDNDSKDGSCDFIRASFPSVRLIESKENLGFGRGNNLGVENALSETILLLNHDTILLDDLRPAIATLQKDSQNGIVAINMLDANKKYIPATGRFPSPLRLLRISYLNDTREPFLTGNFEVRKTYKADWVTGAFMLMRKADFEQIGGFDTDFFMYVEDVDLCKRMADFGKTCIFMPDLRYIHFVGFNKSRENLLLKGYELYADKHFAAFSRTIAKTMITINRIVKRLKNEI
ncbi:glycosyltransferase family 2 protein [Flavobacterium sp. 3HN19-14]|uniref:glycosyltransferase family 2 protein n=1 Tax=Flavobacterium sp. 3HN19-14 TaxID=3448133 RepID=UPI003EE0CC85